MKISQSSKKQESVKLSQLPSVGELERSLSQDLQSSCRKLIGSTPQKITCHLFANCIGIVIEQSVTAVERLLKDQDNTGLARQVRQQVDTAFRQEVSKLVKQRMGVEAKSVLLETSLESGTTGSIVILVSLPNVRNADCIPKTGSHCGASKSDRNGNNGAAPS